MQDRKRAAGVPRTLRLGYEIKIESCCDGSDRRIRDWLVCREGKVRQPQISLFQLDFIKICIREFRLV